MAVLEVNEKDRLFGVNAAGQYDECSDYFKIIAELSISVLD